MDRELLSVIRRIQEGDAPDLRNQLIGDYTPFVVKVLSEVKGGYLDVSNDEEYAIGLEAFNEAIDRFDPERGNFLSFARLVIESRVRNYWHKERRHVHESFEGVDVASSMDADEAALREEIEAFEKVLSRFGLTFENLVEASPRHRDTRQRAKEIGLKAAGEDDLVHHLYEKLRLPVTAIAERFFVSVKIVKRSKRLIMAVMIVVVEKFSSILEWLS